jgi:hypothetical protein
MRSSEALALALVILRHPPLARKARRSGLPRGVTLLLKVAAGDQDALADAATCMDQPETVLQDAAGFFIEQVMLHPSSDNYRVLGASCDASSELLRRHMAFLMRWLHPDIVAKGIKTSGFDRSIYVNRVTKAWEAVKTGDRRVGYDRTLAAQKRQDGAPRFCPNGVDKAVARLQGPSRKNVTLRGGSRYAFASSGKGLWSQLLLLFRRCS